MGQFRDQKICCDPQVKRLFFSVGQYYDFIWERETDWTERSPVTASEIQKLGDTERTAFPPLASDIKIIKSLHAEFESYLR